MTSNLRQRERELAGCRANYGRVLPPTAEIQNVENGRFTRPKDDGLETQRVHFRRRVCIRPFGHDGPHMGPIQSLVVGPKYRRPLEAIPC